MFSKHCPRISSYSVKYVGISPHCPTYFIIPVVSVCDPLYIGTIRLFPRIDRLRSQCRSYILLYCEFSEFSEFSCSLFSYACICSTFFFFTRSIRQFRSISFHLHFATTYLCKMFYLSQLISPWLQHIQTHGQQLISLWLQRIQTHSQFFQHICTQQFCTENNSIDHNFFFKIFVSPTILLLRNTYQQFPF